MRRNNLRFLHRTATYTSVHTRCMYPLLYIVNCMNQSGMWCMLYIVLLTEFASWNTRVAVPCRNWRLFRHVFRSHHCVWSAISQVPYHWDSVKVGSQVCHEYLMNRIWALSLTEVQWYCASNLAMQSKYVTEEPSISTQDCHMYVTFNSPCQCYSTIL